MNSVRFLWLLLWVLLAHYSGGVAQSFSEKEVRIKTNGGYLYGSYCLPSQVSQTPIALIIAGSGPTDRNGNNILAGENNALKMLAVALAEHKIATLRFDKRGLGKSAKMLTDESKLTFDQMVWDAEACLKWMKKQKIHNRVWVIGHSEGSLIGMLAAHRSQADGFVSLAGPGQRASNLLRTQLAQQPETIRDEAYRILDSLDKGVQVTTISTILNPLFRTSVQPYLISWFAYDPCEEIRRLNIPVLVIQGDADLQVKVWDGERLSLCNLNSKLSVISNLNHVLKELDNKDNMGENISTYGDPQKPISSRLISEIVNIIKP